VILAAGKSCSTLPLLLTKLGDKPASFKGWLDEI
jgi:hypothetical protein